MQSLLHAVLRVGKVASVVGHICLIQLANIFACIVEQLWPLELPSCQGHLSLVVCARAAFVVVFFNRRHQTRHAKNCGAIYVLYVCAQHPICMYNDNNDK